MTTPGELSGVSDWFGRRPFVGRVDDLARMRGELKAAIAGRGRVLFLLGEPGTGKSTLISHFMAMVRDRYWRVRVGYGDAADPEHDAWHQLARHFTLHRRAGKAFLRTLPDWIEAVPVVGRIVRAILETVRALRGRKPEEPAAHPRTGSAVEAVRTMLEHGPKTPRLIILDNMEAADAAELSGAAALIKQVTGTSTLLVVAVLTRGGELRAELADLLRESERLGVAVVHRLEGLSASEVANALELSGGGAVPPAWQDWFAAGCPFPPGVLWARMAELAAAGAVSQERHHWWTGLRWAWRSDPPEAARPSVSLPEVTAEEREILGAAA
ncbi:MAG TPA: ATP-binding protein, partial [Longimicrobiales bacterium]|nr:ATP-binding protein [Longimicrobiales bacterium]